MLDILLNLWRHFAAKRMSCVQNGSVSFHQIGQKGIWVQGHCERSYSLRLIHVIAHTLALVIIMVCITKENHKSRMPCRTIQCM